MEGVSNILLLGFQPSITKKEQETTYKCIFFLPIPRKRETKPYFHQAIIIQDQDNNPPRGHTSLAPIFTKRYHQKTSAQERNTIMPKNSENFSQILLTMGELCYEMRFT
jgi:hypothetical protein